MDDSRDEVLVENKSGSKITIHVDVATESGGATLTVGSGGVVSEQGATSTEVTGTSFRVNKGALEVV